MCLFVSMFVRAFNFYKALTTAITSDKSIKGGTKVEIHISHAVLRLNTENCCAYHSSTLNRIHMLHPHVQFPIKSLVCSLTTCFFSSTA